MLSTKDNLSNPTVIEDILLSSTGSEQASSTIDTVTIKKVLTTQLLYDQMQYHDPNTIYEINDSKDDRFYLGDQLIRKFKDPDTIKSRYYIGINENNGDYEIFKYVENNLVLIARYKDPQLAIDGLKALTEELGTSGNIEKVVTLLIDYVDRLIPGIDFFIGLINASGRFKGNTAVIVFINNFKYTFPNVPKPIDNCPGYSDISNITKDAINLCEKYNWFQHKKYHKVSDSRNELLVSIAKEFVELFNHK